MDLRAAEGSFYVSSAANGDWETFITEDVVEYVDANFRTLPSAESRGLTGDSMGGFGALNLSMRHPEVFGAVYATAPGLLGDGGVAEMGFFDTEQPDRCHAGHPGGAQQPLERCGRRRGARRNWSHPLELAYGLAFATDATEPPYLAYPFTRTDGVVTKDDDVWAAWDAGFGDWDLEGRRVRGQPGEPDRPRVRLRRATTSYEWIPDGLHLPRRPAHGRRDRPRVRGEHGWPRATRSGKRTTDAAAPVPGCPRRGRAHRVVPYRT